MPMPKLMVGFRRTLVGLKQLTHKLIYDYHEKFQTNPCGVEADGFAYAGADLASVSDEPLWG